MKTLLAVYLLVSCLWMSSAISDPICQSTIDASSANIAATWVQSTNLRNLRNVQSLFAVNTSTDREILVNCSAGATAPSDSSRNNIPVGGPAGDKIWALDNIGGGSSCWYKANGGTISSGYFKLCVTGN